MHFPVGALFAVKNQFLEQLSNKVLYDYWAKLWNGPGWDKVGIEFTGSQLDPNFLPSLAPTNHPSVLVDISILFYLKEILNKKVTNKLPSY